MAAIDCLDAELDRIEPARAAPWPAVLPAAGSTAPATTAVVTGRPVPGRPA